MADLRPLGSEKLEGMDKIKRIIEISRYKENTPSSINESNRSEYRITLSDGNEYQIIKEKVGYIIKRTLSESKTEYLDPMRDRKYFSSYSQALKRLNLMAKEMNELYGNEKEVSLFSEQKKFVLKTPKPMAPPSAPSDDVENVPLPPQDDMPSMPDLSAGAPTPDVSADMPSDLPDFGGDEGGLDTMGTDDMGAEPSLDAPSPESEEDGGDVNFRMIQKLVGKVSQKLRTLDSKDEVSDEDAKYVINSILSAIDLSKLKPETVEEIMSKFEDYEMESEGGEEMPTSDEEMPSFDEETPETEEPLEMGESWADFGSELSSLKTSHSLRPFKEEMGEESELDKVVDEMFSESKVENILSNYFVITENEKKFNKEVSKNRLNESNKKLSNTVKAIKKFVVSEKQYKTAINFIVENRNSNLIGLTNKKNLVFESQDKQYKITPNGLIL